MVRGSLVAGLDDGGASDSATVDEPRAGNNPEDIVESRLASTRDYCVVSLGRIVGPHVPSCRPQAYEDPLSSRSKLSCCLRDFMVFFFLIQL